MDASRPFSRLLKDSFGLVRADLGLYAALVALSCAPAAVMTLFIPASRSREALEAAFESGDAATILLVSLGGLVTRLIDSFVGVTAVLAAHHRDQGGAPTLADSLRAAAARYWDYLVTGLRALAWIVGGLFLLIIPGLWLALRYSLIPYVVLLEGRTGADALNRSSEIFMSRPWRIVGFLLAAALVIVLCGSFLGAVAGMVLPAVMDELVVKFMDGAAGVWLAVFAVLLYKDLIK